MSLQAQQKTPPQPKEQQNTRKIIMRFFDMQICRNPFRKEILNNNLSVVNNFA
jgi:hypothetical protein